MNKTLMATMTINNCYYRLILIITQEFSTFRVPACRQAGLEKSVQTHTNTNSRDCSIF